MLNNFSVKTKSYGIDTSKQEEEEKKSFLRGKIQIQAENDGD